MSRFASVASLSILLAACEIGEDPKAKPPGKPEAPKIEMPSEKPPMMEAPKPKPPAPADAHKPGGPVGKTAVAASFACPKEGCEVTFPSKGPCLKHGDTEMKEQWFVCEKDAMKEPEKGKCGKCGADLQRVLK
jgi:hypothetical protein